MRKSIQIVVLFIISLCLFACGLVTNQYSKARKPDNYKGEWDKNYEHNAGKGDKKIYPNDLQRATIVDSFNIIPPNIGLIDATLDSSVLASTCFKFIYSPDSSKIIAFYLAQYESPESDFMRRKGGSIMYNDHEQKDGQIRFYGKIVWGMKYGTKWFYNDEVAHVFFDNNLKDARADFLFYTLQAEWFFDKWLTPEYSFWERGGKSIKYLPVRVENYLSVWPEYEGYPILVAEGMGHVRRNNAEKYKLWIKQNLQLIRMTDTVYFNELYTDYLDRYWFDLVSKSGDKTIVSLVNRDTSNNYFLSFFYFELNNDSIRSINRLTKNIKITAADKFGHEARNTFYQQYIADYGYMRRITKDEYFWTTDLPKLLGQSFPVK